MFVCSFCLFCDDRAYFLPCILYVYSPSWRQLIMYICKLHETLYDCRHYDKQIHGNYESENVRSNRLLIGANTSQVTWLALPHPSNHIPQRSTGRFEASANEPRLSLFASSRLLLLRALSQTRRRRKPQWADRQSAANCFASVGAGAIVWLADLVPSCLTEVPMYA